MMHLFKLLILVFSIAHGLEEQDETALLQERSLAESNDDMSLEPTGDAAGDDDLINIPVGVPVAPVQEDPNEPCSKLSLVIENKEQKLKVAVSEECAERGWTLDLTETRPTCLPVKEEKNKNNLKKNQVAYNFPMVCKFHVIQQDIPDKSSTASMDSEPSLGKLAAKGTSSLTTGKTNVFLRVAQVGMRDPQFQWAAKAHAKFLLSSGGCKPSTQGKDAPKPVTCEVCWSDGWVSFPYPCNCVCPHEYHKVVAMCFQSCSHPSQGPYHSFDSGLHCHKPCDRERQVANKVGCGAGHLRNCFNSSLECFTSIVMKVWAIADVLLAVGVPGAGAAIKMAARAVDFGGSNLQMGFRSLKAAMKQGAKRMVKRLGRNGFIKTQLKGEVPAVRDRILENGYILFMSQSAPKEWGDAFLQVASLVDPTGITGVITEFKPKKDCEETSVLDELAELSEEDKKKPDIDVLDCSRASSTNCDGERRLSGGGSSVGASFGGADWEARTNGCTGTGGYTHCEFGQSQGWRKNEMSTWSGGVPKARMYCLEDASNYGAVGAESLLLWGWQYCVMYFPKGTSCSDVVGGKAGYYQEWKGEGTDDLRFGGSSVDFRYCMIR